MSSGFRLIEMAPHSIGADHCVQNRQELSHAGGERDFLWLAGREEALVELVNHWVAPGGHHRGHVQRSANRGAAAPDQALAFERPAVAGQRRDTDERGNLFAREGAEFGQVADERTTDDGADPGDRPQKVFLRAPHGTRVDVAVKVLINIMELALEPADVLEDAVAYGGHGMLETVALSHQHPKDLAPTRQQAVES